ncbi:MAG: glycoside hydrolase family 2 protein, partial [Rhodospirillaceae bacterium]
LRRAFRPVPVALTDEALNGLAIHLINETAETVRGKLSLRCFGGGDAVVMRRERDVELPARSNQTLSSAELIGSFFDITYAYRFGPPPLTRTEVTLDDASGARLAESRHRLTPS